MARFFFLQTFNIELIVKNGNPLGGSAVETFFWKKALNDLGHKVIQAKAENDTRPLLKDYSWVEISSVYNPTKGLRWLRWFYYRLPKVYCAIKDSRCDYLYESIPQWNSFIVGCFCKFLGVKQILRIANDNMVDERVRITHSRFDQFFLSIGFRICDVILTQNDYQYGVLKKKYPKVKIFKIPNPIVIDHRYLNSKFVVQGYIAWVANFRYQKNLQLLYNIVVQLPGEKFKIAGSPMKYMDDESREFVDKLKKLPNVEFMGKIPREKILSFINKAKFLLNTSRYEGFSNTFLESMVVGVPILTTTAVNPDGIIDQYNLGINYENVEDLKLKIKKLSEIEYIEKSKNCIDFVQKHHSHLVVGMKLLNYLGETQKKPIKF